MNTLVVTHNHADTGAIPAVLLASGITSDSTDFGASVVLHLTIPDAEREAISQQLTDATNGRAQVGS